MDKKLLNLQSQHWESNFSSKPEMFGLEPSYSAKKSLEIFKKHNIKNILELGDGLGRDTIYFATNNILIENFGINTGISAMSISDMTKIPRATIIRKCKYLIKEDLIKINEKKQYVLTSMNFRKI